MTTQDCPCLSGKTYDTCCQPYHLGKANPPTPEALMRSRYSAFATGRVDYIIKTTHRENPMFEKNRAKWRLDLALYCREVEFEKLEVGAIADNKVTFTVYVKQHGDSFSLTETSEFAFEQDKWWYRNWTVDSHTRPEHHHVHHEGCSHDH